MNQLTSQPIAFGQWTVTGFNTYYYDDILAPTPWVNYYSIEAYNACNGGGTYQCGESAPQTMMIATGPYGPTNYAPGSSGVQINCGGMGSFRMQ